jgi:hypothetical protein
MTTASNPDPGYAARTEARNAARRLALANGARTITRPLYPGASTTTRDVEPVPGLRAARDLEYAARRLTLDYVRQARETGYSWHHIGVALGLKPGGDYAGETIAEAAFTYAAGPIDPHHALTYGRTVSWTCTTCGNSISDHGLTSGPADDEHGHDPDCQRLARTINDWNAGWEAGQ